jgi:lysophospholipase L1-like esterase
LIPIASIGQSLHIENPIRFLALGDSYTIGQNVPTQARWPVQLADSLEKRGFEVDTLGIIATTGWRTDNLLNAIKNKHLADKDFNLVSVLIGVNNQYQGQPINQYVTELAAILDSAILYAGGDRSHVFVVSIPDYAFTPFGQQSSHPELISAEIDQYNAIAKELTNNLDIVYFDITGISREGLSKPEYVANDGLHPSGIQYTEWVKMILAHIDNSLTGSIDDKDILEEEVSINPNPTSGTIRIELATFLKSQVTRLQLFEISGNKLMDSSYHEKVINLSISAFPDGLYFLLINAGPYQSISKVLKKSN